MSASKSRCMAILSLVLAGVPAFADSTAAAKPVWPAYLFSGLLGFGTGQSYLGVDGAGFLAADLGGIGIMAGGYAYLFGSLLSLYYSPSSTPSAVATVETTGLSIVAAGGVLYLVSRIWEIVDTIAIADRLTKAGKVSISPSIGNDKERLSFGIQFSIH